MISGAWLAKPMGLRYILRIDEAWDYAGLVINQFNSIEASN